MSVLSRRVLHVTYQLHRRQTGLRRQETMFSRAFLCIGNLYTNPFLIVNFNFQYSERRRSCQSPEMNSIVTVHYFISDLSGHYLLSID